MAGPSYYIDNSRGSRKRRGIIGTLRDIAAGSIERKLDPGSASRQIDAQRYREAYIPEQPRVQPNAYAPRGAAYVDDYPRGQAMDYYASAPPMRAPAQQTVYVAAEDPYTRDRSRRHRRRRSSSASSRSSRRGGGGGLGSLAGGIIIGQLYLISLAIAAYLKHASAHRRTSLNCPSRVIKYITHCQFTVGFPRTASSEAHALTVHRKDCIPYSPISTSSFH